MKSGSADFVLLDVRGRKAYARAHVPGARRACRMREITAERMMAWPHDTLFVVYCAGPHCNGADKAALKLARLGRPVKVMLGGMTGWADEGFAFEAARRWRPDRRRRALVPARNVWMARLRVGAYACSTTSTLQ